MFKFLLITLLLIAFVAPLRRFLLWLFVGRQLINQQKKYEAQQRASQRRDGDIRVDYTPPKQDTRFKGGEYVDYEEVKD